MEDSDEVLIERYLAGDGSAFETLYHRHRKTLWRVAMKILHDPDAVEDELQEAFFQIAKHLPRFDASKSGFPVWARTIVWRRAVCLAQKLKRRRTFAVAELSYKEATHLPEPTDGQSTPDEECIAREFDDALAYAVSPLARTERDAFIHRYLYDQTYPQIGEELGACANTVKSRAFKAAERIRPLLASLLHQ